MFRCNSLPLLESELEVWRCIVSSCIMETKKRTRMALDQTYCSVRSEEPGAILHYFSGNSPRQVSLIDECEPRLGYSRCTVRAPVDGNVSARSEQNPHAAVCLLEPTGRPSLLRVCRNYGVQHDAKSHLIPVLTERVQAPSAKGEARAWIIFSRANRCGLVSGTKAYWPRFKRLNPHFLLLYRLFTL